MGGKICGLLSSATNEISELLFIYARVIISPNHFNSRTHHHAYNHSCAPVHARQKKPFATPRLCKCKSKQK
jgi:hypothetical protein